MRQRISWAFLAGRSLVERVWCELSQIGSDSVIVIVRFRWNSLLFFLTSFRWRGFDWECCWSDCFVTHSLFPSALFP